MSVVFNKKNNYCLVNNSIIVSVEDGLYLNKLKNLNNNSFTYDAENEIWIYYNYKSSIPLIKLLYPEEKIISIDFKNNDVNDYRRENLTLTYDKRFIDEFIDPPGYDIINKGTSHKIFDGKFAGQYRNMYWKIKDKNNETYYLMHIKDDIYTKISKRDIHKVLNINNIRCSWYLNTNGYIGTILRSNNNVSNIYLHQLIMDVHDEDLTNMEKTVDHINQDKLDNRRTNLRLVNMSIQNANRNKPERRFDACDLPDGIQQTDLPKYVVYRKEILDKDTGNFREYFYICNHPDLDKNWETTKSQKVTIREKLKQVKLKLQELNGDITQKQYMRETNTENKIDLPIGIRLNKDIIPHKFIFDLRKDDCRYGLNCVLKSNDLQKELDVFIDTINKKYPDLNYESYQIKNIKEIKQIKETNVSHQKQSDQRDTIKLVLPPNFSFYFEAKSKSYYFSFSKSEKGVKIGMKKKINTNNIQNEFDNFIKLVNDKYPHIKPIEFTIQNVDNIILFENNTDIQLNIIAKTSNTSTKPIMPANFSICSVNNIDYIQFCKKINNKRYQYKTKINSYDLNVELDNFINELNEKYNVKLINSDYKIINTNGWQSTNKIVDHSDTDIKLEQRAQAIKYLEKRKLELGEEEFKKQKAQYAQQYRNKNKQQEIEI